MGRLKMIKPDPNHPMFKEGWTVFTRSSKGPPISGAKERKPPFPYSNPVSRRDAIDIAFRFGLFGILEDDAPQPEAYKWNDIPFKKPNVFGLDTSDKDYWWVVYGPVNPEKDLTSSQIVIVDERDAEVSYMGLAYDEG